MNERTPDGAPSQAFQALMGEVMADAPRFGHRQHIQLAWLAVRRHGTEEAARFVGEGIRRTATAGGAPQKFHATMTRAWVELVGHHTAADGRDGVDGFDAFTERHPELLDKNLLARHYRPETLAGEAARLSWVEPDLLAFPWRSDERAHGAHRA